MVKEQQQPPSKLALLLLALSTVSPALGFLLSTPTFTRPVSTAVPTSATSTRSWSAAFVARSSLASSSGDDEFLVGVLGDLHLDPRDMRDYRTGRAHWRNLFRGKNNNNAALVSLGDLGESQAVRSDTTELFAGTSECHKLAASYLKSFGVPYELVGGNHDLEGIDEFSTDEENLRMMLDVHGKPTPQFLRQIADKTLLVGLTSTVFRDAKYTSHEVTIDQQQMDWFEDVLQKHPARDGWKIFVFTHAPPLGSGLKVLPENHVVNGCCWLNHSDAERSRKFIELVREHRCIKAWFSGHFHLGQNYQDSITFPNDDDDVDRGSCVFVQTSVMRSGTSRDGSQQSRLIRGNKDGFEICTVDHQRNGQIRLDATVKYQDADHEVGEYAHTDDDESSIHDTFVQVYNPPPLDETGGGEAAPYPSEEDLVEYENYMVCRKNISEDTTAWWYLKCGRVLGIFSGMLLEYDPSTLAPLGLVVGADELVGKRIAVIDASGSGTDSDSNNNSGDGDDDEVQAVVLIDEASGKVVVVQPNEDGSYWRKIVRNKLARMREKRREEAAAAFVEEMLGLKTNVDEVVSSWGPYKTTSGTAKHTGVEGLTVPHPAEEEMKRIIDIEGLTTIPTTLPVAVSTTAASSSSSSSSSGAFNVTRLEGLSI